MRCCGSIAPSVRKQDRASFVKHAVDLQETFLGIAAVRHSPACDRHFKGGFLHLMSRTLARRRPNVAPIPFCLLS